MTVAVRTFQALGEPKPNERFMSLAIAEDRKGREGFAVRIYAATAEEAEAKAHDWIEAERKRQEEIAGNMAAGAEKNRRSAAEKRAVRA